MKKCWISALVAAACVLTTGTTAFASPLRLEQTVTAAAATIYDYQPLIYDALHRRSHYGNTIYCSAQERLCGQDGQIYRLADSSPLSDTSLFRTKIQLLINAPAVDTLMLAKEEQGYPGRTSFILTLEDDWLYQDVMVKFQVTFTALQDTVLSVLPTGANAPTPQQMQVNKGEQIAVQYTVHISDEDLFIGNYDGDTLPPARYEQLILPGDPDFPCGPVEVILTPKKDKDADLTWDDVGKLVAQVNFAGGAPDGSPKLSACWEDTGLPGSPELGDCYARVFVGNPKVQSGEMSLILTNPFLTEKGEETIPHHQVVLYEILDGQLVDISRRADYGADSDGNGAFLLTTDHLGSYVLSKQALL